MESQQLLKSSIADLLVSEDFSKQSKKMGFETLEQIVQVPPRELVEHPEFTYRWMLELLTFLKAKGLLALMQHPREKKKR